MPPAARKSTATKATAKKTTAKKATAQKGTAKKAAAGKAAAKKATAKTTTARKASAAATALASAQSAASTAASSAQAGVEDAVLRVRELQGQLLESARRGGTHYLQAYEKNLSSMLELTENAAESTQLSWAVTLANNYADFVKRVNEAVMKAGRQALG
jgi:hypothetical protein